ncbi:MAG: hypothetical protein ACREOU_08295 [Candidatus Eiseniibacteriota bacterium]
MGRIVGIILILAGLAGLAWGGFTWTQKSHEVDLGPVEIDVNERRSVPIPPVAGAVAIAAGIVLIVLDRRRATAL